ncbi:MAG: collagen-like protein, partial [Treponema sp.]|nr:collagen-like protein [Treponema sp.]
MSKSIRAGAILLLVFAFGFAACEGPIGPAGAIGETGAAGIDGAAGPQGPQGSDGTDGTDGQNGAAGAKGEDGRPAFPNGVSLSSIVEVGGSTKWVDITTVASIDPTEFFTFSSGTIDGTSDLGVLEMDTDNAAYAYSFEETGPNTGYLLVDLPDDGDWSLVRVAAYTFNRGAGTLTFADVEGIGTPTFGGGEIYAVDNSSSLALTDGTYSYTNGSGIEIDKASGDTAKGSFVVAFGGAGTVDFSDTESIFGDLADESGVTIAWLGNTLYGITTSNNVVSLDSLGELSADKFILGGNSFELRNVPADLLNAGAAWAPKNANSDALSDNLTGTFKNIKFTGTAPAGTLAYDTNGIGS